MTRQIVVEIVGETSGFHKSVDGAITKSGSLTTKLQGVGKGMVIGAGIGAFGLLTDAVGLAVGKMDEAHQAFLLDQTSAALLTTALRNNVPGWDGNTAAVEAYATAQGRLGFADDDVRASLGQLIGVTHDLTEAQSLNSMAQDLARAKGIDLAQATDIITKAHEGNGKALKGLGIDIGTAKTAEEMLAAVTLNAAGAAETFAATSEGRLAVSQVKVGESMEKVGAVIDSVSQNVMPVIADAFVNVTDAVGKFVDENRPLINQIGGVLKTVMSTLGNTVIPALGAAFNWIVKNVIPPVSVAIELVVQHVRNMIQIWQNVAGVIVSVAGTIGSTVNTIVGFFSGIGARIASATAGMWNGIWSAFKGVINTIIRGWNGLRFSLPSVDLGPLGKFGGFTIGTPNLPYLHAGGIVPGAPGADVLTVLQAGERVTPRGQAGAVTINVNGPVYGDGIDDLARKLARYLRTTGAIA